MVQHTTIIEAVLEQWRRRLGLPVYRRHPYIQLEITAPGKAEAILPHHTHCG